MWSSNSKLIHSRLKLLRRAHKLAFIWLLLLSPTLSKAEEKIISYHSEIEILESSELVIEETIKVLAEGKIIKRGIYRSFPTDYTTDSGKKVQVGFDVLSVKRNSKPEPFHTRREKNGISVYMGEKSVLIPKGEHTYTIKFKTNQQLGFFENHDELYFNAIGHGWKFPIETATASLILPQNISLDDVEIEGYTGTQGFRGKDFSFSRNSSRNSIEFLLEKELKPGQGFTFVAKIPKGLIEEPSTIEQAKWFVNANKGLTIICSGLVFSSLYLFLTWLLVGIDPKKGTIIPQFEAPEGLSPQEVRFLREMEFDDKCFASALVHMAYQGAIKLKEATKVSKLRLILQDPSLGAGPGEQEILGALLKSKQSNFEFTNKFHHRINNAKRRLKKILSKSHKKSFLSNEIYWLLGIAMIVISLGVGFYMDGGQLLDRLFVPIWVALCLTLLTRSLFKNLIFNKNRFASHQLVGLAQMLFGLGVVGFVGLNFEIESNLLYYVLPPLFFAILYFKTLLKAPTAPGRALMDKIEGYQMYLETAEKDRLSGIELPEINQELFEKHLPYAFALDADQQWTERFLRQLNTSPSSTTGPASPSWYLSSSNFSSSSGLSRALDTALVGSIAAASRAPGGSSGSSGGSSGGGGGGGGGGGW